MSGRTVAFGPFLLDPDNGTLFRDGELVAIGQKAALLLGALVTSPGQVRTKTELMDAAWPGTTVEESNLSVQIASLRKLLGPSPAGGEWIATVPRVGYRFVSQPEAATTKPDARSEPVIPSLAVLPFQNMSGDPEQEYFADGIVEDIITALSRFRSFAVIARNSSFVYKGRAVDVRQVARELGVRYVLEGSVRRAGSATADHRAAHRRRHRARISGPTSSTAPSKTYSTCRTGSPTARSASSSRKSGAPKSSGRAGSARKTSTPTISICRRCRRCTAREPEGNAEAYALMERAIALEPNYGPFLAGAIWILTRRVVMGWPTLTGDDRAAALDLVRRALAVADGDAAVLAQCGAP